MGDEKIQELEFKINVLEHKSSEQIECIRELMRITWIIRKFYKFIDWVNAINKKIYEFLCSKNEKEIDRSELNE